MANGLIRYGGYGYLKIVVIYINLSIEISIDEILLIVC